MPKESPPLSEREFKHKQELARKLFGNTILRSGERMFDRNLRIVQELRALSPILPREVELAGLFYQLPENQRGKVNIETSAILKDLDKLSIASHAGVHSFAGLIKAHHINPGAVLVRMASAVASLHNLNLPSDERERIARIALHIHAPAARAMGLEWSSSVIGNLALRHAEPADFKAIDESLDKGEKEFKRKVQPVLIAQIRAAAEKMGVHYETSESVKQPYEVWRKLQEILKEYFHPDALLLNDAVRMRVVIGGTDSHCYQLLKHLQETSRLKVKVSHDYIKKPRNSGYRALHVLLQPQESKNWYELQIRTKQMHEAAEGSDARQLHGLYLHNKMPPEQRRMIADIAERAKSHLTASWLNASTFKPPEGRKTRGHRT